MRGPPTLLTEPGGTDDGSRDRVLFGYTFTAVPLLRSGFALGAARESHSPDAFVTEYRVTVA